MGCLFFFPFRNHLSIVYFVPGTMITYAWGLALIFTATVRGSTSYSLQTSNTHAHAHTHVHTPQRSICSRSGSQVALLGSGGTYKIWRLDGRSLGHWGRATERDCKAFCLFLCISRSFQQPYPDTTSPHFHEWPKNSEAI